MFSCNFGYFAYDTQGTIKGKVGSCGQSATTKYSGTGAEFSWTGYRCAKHSGLLDSSKVKIERIG